MAQTFRALRYRNYRLFFGGQTVSLIGTWMQTVAMAWLVYTLTHSPLYLGLDGFCVQIPMFFIAPFAGALIERKDKRKVLIATQIAAGCEACLLGLLVLTHQVQVWHVIALSSFLGLVNAFDMPTRQAFLVEMVEDRSVLGNAIALNSTQFNIARLIGPPIAGALIQVVGMSMCFLINAGSYIAVIGALMMMRVTPKEVTLQSKNMLRDIREGFHYVSHSIPIRSLLMLIAIASLASGAYATLITVVAKDEFHGNAQLLGFFYGSVGAGALVAAVSLAARSSVVGLARLISRTSALFGASLIVFGLSHNLILTVIALAVMGFSAMTHMASTNTVLQTVVDDNMRGRVMAFYAMSFVGTMPLGSLLAGQLADRYGLIGPLVGAGVITLVGSAWFLFALPAVRAKMRPIYEEKGILPRPVL
jgi:MFS family permease